MGRKVSKHKKCKRCGEVKPRSEFTKVTGLPNAVHSNCKSCNAEVARQRYAEKPKQETAVINRRAKLKKAFGLTLERYNEILDSQHGRCAICGTETPGGRGSFVVDHCHSSDMIRGLLCNACNIGLGHFKDDPRLLLKAIDYLIVGGGNHGFRG